VVADGADGEADEALRDADAVIVPYPRPAPVPVAVFVGVGVTPSGLESVITVGPRAFVTFVVVEFGRLLLRVVVTPSVNASPMQITPGPIVAEPE
jgi:hypothetical protein